MQKQPLIKCMEQIDLLNQMSSENTMDLCSELMTVFFKATSVKDLVGITESTFERFIPLDYSGLYIYNEQTERLELLVAQGFSEEEKWAAEASAMERHPGLVYRTGKAIYIPDTQDDQGNLTSDSPRSFFVRTRLYSPVVVGGKRIGVFGVVSSRINAFSTADIALFNYICKLAGKVYTQIKSNERLENLNSELRVLSFLATHTDNSVIITDSAGCITWVNQEFSKLTGFSLHEAIGQRPGHLLQGKRSDPKVIERIGHALKRKEPFNCVIKNYTKQGEEYVVDLSIYPFFNENGDFSHFISLQRNVTQEFFYKEQIENQRIKLDAILSSIPDLIFVIGENGLIEEYFLSKDFHHSLVDVDFSGASIYDFVSGADSERMNKVILSAFSSTQISNSEFTCLFDDITVYCELRMVQMNQNKLLCVFRNINDQLLYETEKLRIQNFNKLLSDFSIKLSLSDANEVDGIIDGLLIAAGKKFHSDSVFFVDLLDGNQEFSSRIFDYSSKKWKKKTQALNTKNEHLLFHLNQLKSEEILNYSFSLKNNPELKSSHIILQALGASDDSAFKIMPVIYANQLIAFFGFTFYASNQFQNSIEISEIKLLGDIVVSAIHRKQYIIELSRFKAIFDNGYFGALILNHRNEIVYNNLYANKYFNDNSSLNDPVKIQKFFSGIIRSELSLSYKNLLADDSDSSKVVALFDTRGKEVHLLFKHLVLDQPNKRKPFIALSFIDISDLIKQESETNKALQIVSEQNRKLLNFSYIVSHNIRSHASNISGFLQLAESENDVSTLHVYLDALSKSSKALDGTLRHLNELLNIQSRVGVHPVPIDLNEIVVKTIAALSSDLSQIPHSFQLDFSNPFMIHADQAYADSIMLNLISNAIKYRKSDFPLEIIISAKKLNDESIIYVKDNGKGIDLDKYGEKVFGMFKTFHGNRDARGIGLFITKNQIESMGGSIQLESSPGNGATFTIYLPD